MPRSQYIYKVVKGRQEVFFTVKKEAIAWAKSNNADYVLRCHDAVAYPKGDRTHEVWTSPMGAAAAAPVPTGEEIRGALRHGADVLRKAAEQPKPTKVDPKIRFR